MPEFSAAVADLVVDCTGLACPLPVVKTAQAIKNLAQGQVLELLATDPGVEPDMRAEIFHILIRRVK